MQRGDSTTPDPAAVLVQVALYQGGGRVLACKMDRLTLHEFHEALGAEFAAANGAEVVACYGDALLEHAALTQKAGVLDLSFRSRVCLTGPDRIRFLHG